MSETPASPYRFERLDASQLWAVQALYRSAFGLQVTIEELTAKYDTARFGAAYTGVLAYGPDGDPAAYYGVFPIRVRVAGKAVLAAQSGDTMTSPAHRMKGLFTQTARMAYQIAAEEGVAFVFGFPNENSYPGFKAKLNWVFYGNMDNFRIKVPALPLVPLAKKYPACAPMVQRWVERRLRRIALPPQSLPAGALDTASIAEVAHDLDFLEYKLSGRAHLVQWQGFKMMVRLDGELVLGGVSNFPAEETARFITGLRALARRLFCHRILIQVNQRHWLHKRMVDAGLTPQESLPVGFLPLLEGEYHFPEMAFSKQDADTF